MILKIQLHINSNTHTLNPLGYDSIPNELLKNSSFDFKQYLLIFYNKILGDGVVPQALNIGKCMLVYKVSSGIPQVFGSKYYYTGW